MSDEFLSGFVAGIGVCALLIVVGVGFIQWMVNDFKRSFEQAFREAWKKHFPKDQP